MLFRIPQSCLNVFRIARILLILLTSWLSAADPTLTVLPFHAIDAEGDPAHGRIVLVAESTGKLYTWNTQNGNLLDCDLPAPPTCVSVSPDGMTAVVGHDHGVTLVDLSSMTQIASWYCSTKVSDIVHGGNDYAYAFPSGNDVDVKCGIRLSDGEESPQLFYPVHDDTRGRLRPGISALYEITASVPDYIAHLSTATSPIQYEKQSLFGGYGGNIWFNDLGTLILSSSGKLCRANDGADDLDYVGHFPASTGSIVWADHGGSAAGWFAAIPSSADTRIDLVNGDLFDLVTSKSLPGFSGGSVPAHGRWVFLSQDGNTAYVVAEASPASGLSDDQGIATIDLTPQPGIAISSPTAGATLESRFPLTYRTTDWPPPAGGSVSWLLDGVEQGVATNPLQLSGLAIGDHTIRVELRNHLGVATGVADSITVHVLADQPDVCRLTSDVVDAEGDLAHDRLILVSASPPRIHRWDASTNDITSCGLPIVPTCLSVSPDGSTAVIGHDSRITLVDLGTMTQIATWPCSSDIFDIVHGGNGHAYVFPRTGGVIHCIDLSTGGDTGSWQTLYSRSRGRLRPGSAGLYVACEILNPGYIELYDVAVNPAQYLRRSPVTGISSWGSNIWFNRLGTRIISQTGFVYQASGDASVDMAYTGHLPVGTGNIAWIDHGGSGSGRYAAIPAANDSRIDLINAELLDAAGSRSIPPFASLGGPVPTHGRWVFLSPDGNTAYVVAQAGAGAGLINDHGIATIDVTPQPGIDITSPASDATLGSSFSVTYRTTAWPPPPGGSVTWSLDGIAQGAATNPLQLSGLALGDHTVQLELRDHLGVTTGVADSIAVHVLADQPGFYRLTTDVVDAEGVPTHGWVILASASPPRLHRWEAATQALTGCDLPAVPTCVSVSPDGATAVVGHDSRATLVDLATMTQVATWTCAVDAFDIVHGGDGYAYLFARSPDWGPVHRLDLSSGAETSNSGSYVQAHTHARLCPGKPLIYDATNLSSPSRLNCTYIGEGTVQHLRASPSQNDHAPDGGLWFNRQGTRIIARSGNLYQASGDASIDMAYAGRLPVSTGSVVCIDHGGSAAGWYAAIPTADDSRIDLIHADILDPAGTICIPAFASRDGPVPAHGRWVFLSQDGDTAYVIAQASADAGLINDQGIATIDLTPPPSITITSPSHGSMLGSGFTVTYRTSSWPPLAGGSVAWSLDGVDQGAASGPLQFSGLSNGDHAIHLELRDHLGNATGAADSVSIQVRADRSDLYRLATDVIDAEGDPVHGRVILVSAAPPAIHRWDAATRALSSCNLAAVPICVSVSSDGTTAVVGHRGSVSAIELASMTQTASWPCVGSMADVIHGGNGIAYILPHSSSQLQAIDLSTGASSSTTGSLSGWWLLGRLRPGTTKLYVADTGTSPDNLECFDVSSNPAQLLRPSPYWGDHPFGGNIWFNDQGSRFIAASGNVFRAGDGVDTDMTYVGHIPSATGSIYWADHGGNGVGQFVVIPTAARTRIDLVNVDFLDAAGSKSIPTLPVRGGPISALGRWVFLSQDGQTAYVVVQADTGLMDDFGIATIDLHLPEAPRVGVASAGDERATVTFSPPSYAGLSPITGYLVTSAPGGITASGVDFPVTVTGLNNGTTYTFTVTAINGAGTGPASAPSNAVTPRCAMVTYHVNGGSGSIASSVRTHGVPMIISDGYGFSLAGYAFAGWNTEAEGSGTSFPGGALFSGEVDVTLFAQWSSQSSGEPAGSGESQGCGAGALSGFLALGMLLGLRTQRKKSQRPATSSL